MAPGLPGHSLGAVVLTQAREAGNPATVKTHLLHIFIFAKLGVDDRTAAVTVALERGILRLSPQER